MQTITEPPARLLGRYSYPTSHRVIEIVAVGLWLVFGGIFAWRTVGGVAAGFDVATAGLVVLAVVAAVLVADVASGLVHALCDNLGSVHTPVVGQKFIRSFREHHTDPLDMTRGDFIRVNADNFLVCLPILVPAVLWLSVADHLFWSTFIVALAVFVVFTNQIHKWAHLAKVGESVPAVVRVLQARGVILSPAHHDVHHTPPYDSHYCITSGITNPFLTRIGFWPALMRFCRWVGRRLPGSPATGDGSPGPGA